jgi:hypothetical protein
MDPPGAFRVTRWLRYLPPAFGAVNCVAIAGLFATYQQPLFPLPGLYLLEIAAAGLTGLWAVRHLKHNLLWGITGILLAFVILGAWTIGLYLLPGTAAFLVTAITLPDRRVRRGLISLTTAGLAQAFVILALAGIL